MGIDISSSTYLGFTVDASKLYTEEVSAACRAAQLTWGQRCPACGERDRHDLGFTTTPLALELLEMESPQHGRYFSEFLDYLKPVAKFGGKSIKLRKIGGDFDSKDSICIMGVRLLETPSHRSGRAAPVICPMDVLLNFQAALVAIQHRWEVAGVATSEVQLYTTTDVT